MTPEERAEIIRRAKARAREMGHRTDPDPDPGDPPRVQLPTLQPGALRALMNRGHLTPEQETAARRLFAEAARIAREDTA